MVAQMVWNKKPVNNAGELLPISESIGISQNHEAPSKHKVRVGLYQNKPKVYTDKNGQPSGIFIEILKAIAQKENWQLVFVPCKWAECLKALKAGQIDLMPDVAFSPARAREMDFPKEKVIESWSKIYSNKKILVENISDVNGLRLAVLAGSIQEANLRQMFKGFGYDVKFVEANSFEKAFTLAANGTADMVVSNYLFGDYFYKKYRLASTAIVFDPVSLYFATTHGENNGLLEALDNDLRSMKTESGSVYYKALSHWMITPPETLVPQYLTWVIGSVVVFLALAFIIILLLRRLVISRTRHLILANKKLHESEEKFRNLFYNHSAVKLIVDPENGAIVEVNKAAERFYGWPAEQLQQKRIQDINADSSERDDWGIEEGKTHIQSHHKLADGSIKDVEIFTSRVDINGKSMLHSVIHDVTEHRQLEEQYRQAQKMESVGRLAGGVAHDYNNMLGVILGYTDLALQKVGSSQPLRSYLEAIHNAAKRSADITRQLLMFARKQSVSLKIVDVNDIAESMIKMLRHLIGEDIDLVWLPQGNLPPVKMDPSQIEQILVNLCVNARDAITGVGKITIETGMATIDEDYCTDHFGFIPGEFVLLSVSDDGAGMDKETLDYIFEPFFTTKSVNKGTGLGLATVYGIVKQNNGFINVYSEPGKGATFGIYLPSSMGKVEKHKEETVDEVPAGCNETVLLVEDDTAMRQMVKLMYEKLGYKVLAVGTGTEALHLVSEHLGTIQLLCTDVIMPEMNGRDLANEVNRLQPNIKVLFMSGYTADVINQRGMLDEDTPFIQKPFSMQNLSVKVRELLD